MNPWEILGQIIGWLLVVIVGIIAIGICICIAVLIIIIIVSIAQQAYASIRAKFAGKPLARLTLLPKRKEADDA